jgi:putative sterol carrier protein
MGKLKYLSPEWTQEAAKHLREQLTPELMKHVSSSMLTLYQDCPDGQARALFYKFVNGALAELSVTGADRLPEAEFTLTGSYDTFARISRAELGARAALMSGKLKLKGNLVKALGLAAVVDRMNKVLASIPTEY